MASFVVDEDLPVALAEALRGEGHQAVAVRELGMRGASDAQVFAYDQEHGATLISADLGFANVLDYPPGTHFGIVVTRVPDDLAYLYVIDRVVAALKDIPELTGNLAIVEPARVRIRRP